jgi:hypothetical protein
VALLLTTGIGFLLFLPVPSWYVYRRDGVHRAGAQLPDGRSGDGSVPQIGPTTAPPGQDSPPRALGGGRVRSILTRLNLAETGDDHRRVLAAITYLEAR